MSIAYKVQKDFGLVHVNVFGKFFWFVILLAFVANFVIAICLFVIFDLVTL